MPSAVIMGYHELSVRTLEIALESGFDVPLVVLNPSSRLPKVQWYRDLGRVAREMGIKTLSPANIRKDRTLHDTLVEMNPDVVISVNYHLIISPDMLDIPRYGFWNFHDSLLPEYRGQAPSIFEMMNGERYGGMTLHRIDEDIDTGPIYLQKKVRIGRHDLIRDLYLKVTEAGVEIARKFFDDIRKGNIKTREQTGEGSYYRWNFERDARINPEEGIHRCWNKYRALAHPFPGAYFEYNGRMFHILEAKLRKTPLSPGKIKITSRREMLLGCGDGSLAITVLGYDDGWLSPQLFLDINGLNEGEVVNI